MVYLGGTSVNQNAFPERPPHQTPQEDHSGVDSTLLALDFRWPTAFSVDAFRRAHVEFRFGLWWRSLGSWPKALTSYLRRCLDERLLDIPENDQDALKWALREVSALGAMLMHLRPTTEANQIGLVNGRRSRTQYGTYPTSPRVAQAAARYVWNRLTSSRERTSKPYFILDPTMEGGPMLLEMAFLASGKAARTAHCAPGYAYDFVLAGVDQNPISATFVATLLETWRSQSVADNFSIDLTCRDAIDSLVGSESLDAIVNNPPWGGRTDGASSERLSHHGPYVGYRDPYIALVSLGLARLNPTRPFGLVLPFQLLMAASAAGLRQELLENTQLEHVVLLPRKAFPRATVKTVMLLGYRRRNGERLRGIHVVRYPIERRISDRSVPAVSGLNANAVARLTAAPWMTIIQADPPFVPAAKVIRLGQIADVLLGVEPYRVGRGSPKQTHQDVARRPFTFDQFREGTVPVARSRNIRRFCVGTTSEFIRFGPWLAAPGRNLEIADLPRVFVRQICARDGSLVAAVAPSGMVARYGVFTVVCDQVSPDILCAILNSTVVARYVRLGCASYHKESFGRITIGDLRELPIPIALLTSERGVERRTLHGKLMSKVACAKSAAGIRDRVSAKRATEEIDSLIELAFGWSVQLSSRSQPNRPTRRITRARSRVGRGNAPPDGVLIVADDRDQWRARRQHRRHVYYKVQVFDDVSLTWLDEKKAFDEVDDARLILRQLGGRKARNHGRRRQAAISAR
jgi:hypothetical protein